VGGDLRHVFVGRQFVADLGAVTSRYQDIEVADGIPPPPVAACHHDLALPNRLAQRMGKGLRLGFRNREPEALFGFARAASTFFLTAAPRPRVS
jgi:hypothetical protein